jgi:Second Messenger Oligonucleotide or Dinucleotide Synthetase domain
MVPNERFKELLADIEPSSTTKSNASSAHTDVRSYLQTHEVFKQRWKGDFLAGSYSRDTAIRPKKTADGYERPDVDIIIETNFLTSDDPISVLQELSDALEGTYQVERINKRSVRIGTTNVEIDVVPVVASGTIYELPDRELGHWKMTNPPGHNKWSSDQNTNFDNRFKPLVKLFKWWRRENKAGKRPKGFVLEVLVAMHAPTDEGHYGEAFAQMLENIYSTYGTSAQADQKPFIEDPGLPGNDIISKVSITDWKNFIERVRVHAEYARKGQSEENMEEATRLWRKLFGNRFKTTVNAAKDMSLNTYEEAPVVSVGYTFPSTPATPKKPRGFA